MRVEEQEEKRDK